MNINNQCNKLAYEKALEVLAPQFLNKQAYISYSDALKCYQGLHESLIKKVNQKKKGATKMKMFDDQFYTQFPYMLIHNENGLPTVMHIMSPQEDHTECFRRYKKETWKNLKVFKAKYKKNSDPWYIPRIKEQKRTLKTIQIVKTTDFEVILRKAVMAKPVYEITKEKYHEALNILPPVNWCRVGDFEMFCMSERITYSYTTQYAHDTLTGRYYLKTVDIDNPTTWIHNFFEETRY